MKGYKGMDKNMQCRGKQYAIGETYIEEKADLCNVGMHYCELPHDVFGYYSPGFSRYFEVEAEDVSNKKDNDSKRVCKRLKIGAEISATVICKIAVKAFFEKFEFDKKIEEAKKSDKTSAGNRGAASAGEYGAALVMKNGQAEVGLNGVAVAEHNGRVKGDIGAVLVLIERDENGKPNVKVRVVDGQKIKANTWYLIKNGRVQEG